MIDLHTVVRKAEKEIAKQEAIKQAAQSLLTQLEVSAPPSTNGNGSVSHKRRGFNQNSIHARVLRVYGTGDPLTPGQVAKRIGTSRKKVIKCISNNAHEFQRVAMGVYKLK